MYGEKVDNPGTEVRNIWQNGRMVQGKRRVWKLLLNTADFLGRGHNVLEEKYLLLLMHFLPNCLLLK